jgi:hypothetical protein
MHTNTQYIQYTYIYIYVYIYLCSAHTYALNEKNVHVHDICIRIHGIFNIHIYRSYIYGVHIPTLWMNSILLALGVIVPSNISVYREYYDITD